MAKEADLKKIELWVSVNCCDGCKRKVKKALLGVEGVLKTEIDPVLPKVTAVGNVDPKILIKKLLKAGKQAELWSNGNQNAANEKKEVVDKPSTEDKVKPKSEECEKVKSSNSCANRTTEKDKATKNVGDGKEDKAAKKDEKGKSRESSANPSIPEVSKNENPPPEPEMNGMVFPNTLNDAGNLRTNNQYCYMVEPFAIPVPYYAIPSYTTQPLPPTFYGQPYYCHEGPLFQPPFQAPATRVGDYFSDENTVGCSVM